ncbi:MAG: general secretion pathway protein GspE [Planctomycetaceae bacterium]|nr:general secretion pathway protein GspE [Planctomycetaceae bacterium]
MNETANESAASAGRTDETQQRALQEELRELVDVVGPGPMVDLLLERAFQLRATDVHLDPAPDGLRVRLRVDGLLHDVLKLPTEMTSQVVSRLKLMGNMDITERRFAQDGHISNAVLKHQRDIRVGTGPTIYGERMVLRLMPDESTFSKLDELGLSAEQAETLGRYVRVPYGMILSVGPVGSGKSTTMYACLELLNDSERSLVTIEDPVERRIGGVNQIQVDPKIDFTFVSALRGVLRQDPDVMMIGEIRDPETAQIGVRAGLTGVTVLSTLHANDAVSTIDVFGEFGISPMFIGDSVRAIVSQRLLRTVCPHCRTTSPADASSVQLLELFGEDAQGVELAKGTGCGHCFQTGHLGRTGVFEILGIDSDVRVAILQRRSHDEIEATACAQGMKTLVAMAREKVLAGETSIDEMHRVLSAVT